MDNRIFIGRKTLRGALDVRNKAKCGFDTPASVYDIIEKLGISVWFHGGGSFGGMYSKETKTILVPSLRPMPRQRYTCAHELGHWYYGHGSKLDVYEDEYRCQAHDNEELMADLFAGHFLMPPGAVAKAFKIRSIDPERCSQFDFYRVVSQLGVGYGTLLNHMYWTQKNISRGAFDRLKQYTPKAIRNELLGSIHEDPGFILLVDRQWNYVPIDLQVGHVAIVQNDINVKGKCLELLESSHNKTIIRATTPGVCSIENDAGSWASFVRVSRKDFQGRSVYRHLEEADDD